MTEHRPAPDGRDDAARSSRAPGDSLIRLIGWIVPETQRDEWRAEWRGELAHAWDVERRRGRDSPVARAQLLARCLGAVPDALWIRRHHHRGRAPVIGHDLRYAVRVLGRRPGFTTVVVLTLALGIGANTAIFSVVNGILLRSLPFQDPDRLVMLWGEPTDGDYSKVNRWSSYPDFLDIRSAARSFESLAAYRLMEATVTDARRDPVRLTTASVTANLFPTLGIAPAAGRGFLPAEEQPGANAVAVVGHAFASQRFGGAAGALGGSVEIDGVPHTIVGVMPESYRFPPEVQIWRPIDPVLERPRGVHRLRVLGRLAPNVDLTTAQREVRAVAKRLEEAYPADNAKRSAVLEPMRESLVGDIRPALLVLLGAVGMVLLIGCVNIANLFLARAVTREREVAVRTALGAPRGRLLRQFLTESLLLTVGGGLLGLLLAIWGLDLLLANVPQEVPRADEIGIDGRVLGFVASISLATGLAFGVLPAMQSSRVETRSALKEARGAAAGGRRRLRQLLVVSEVALAMVLVIGAGLLVKSFRQLGELEPGFDPDDLLAVPLQLPISRYPSEEHPKVTGFYRSLREQVAALPGVRRVTVAYEHPLGEGWTSSFAIEGREPPPEGLEPESRIRPIQPGYFRTAGVAIVAGRDIDERDTFDAPGVVVVNEAFARAHFPNESPLGQRITRRNWWPEQNTSYEIVGVAADEKFRGLDMPADPATYFAHAQFPMNDMWLLVRTAGDPLSLAPAIRRAVWRLDRDLPVEGITTMEAVLRDEVAAPRFNASLMSLFAAVALLLAAIGVYGVLSYGVTERTGEFGIRLALGARPTQVVRSVVVQGVALAGGGIVLGVLGAVLLSRLLAPLLHDVSPTDPTIYSGVGLLLTGVGLAAAYLPAKRASRVAPVDALRYE